MEAHMCKYIAENKSSKKIEIPNFKANLVKDKDLLL